MSRPRIVFVDDEPAVLGGLRRQLFDQRRHWDMEFAGSGMDGLALVQAAPVDVLVSDMRMPGMDGAELLERVRRASPSTVRILLTGYTDQEQSLRSARSAHQFLNKPCDPAALRSALAHALELRGQVEDASLKADLARLVALPVQGPIQSRIQAELDRGDCSLRRLGELVEGDPGLAAKALQLVNSAAMGMPTRVLRPAQAVALLGVEHLRSLWISFQLRTLVAGAEDLKEWSGTGEAVALRTRELLRPFGDGAALKGFSAGLLHDIGALALACCRPEAWQAVRGLGSLEAERSACGADHAGTGAYLLGLWGLDGDVVRAVGRHHREPDPEDPLQAALSRAAMECASKANNAPAPSGAGA